MLTHQPTEETPDHHQTEALRPMAIALITMLVSAHATVAVVTVWLLVYANLTPWTQILVCAAVPAAIGTGGLTAGRLLTRSSR
ncbi:MAG: hypothetical protein AAF467_27835 [Actinomycetota bacterium]